MPAGYKSINNLSLRYQKWVIAQLEEYESFLDEIAARRWGFVRDESDGSGYSQWLYRHVRRKTIQLLRQATFNESMDNF